MVVFQKGTFQPGDGPDFPAPADDDAWLEYLEYGPEGFLPEVLPEGESTKTQTD